MTGRPEDSPSQRRSKTKPSSGRSRDSNAVGAAAPDAAEDAKFTVLLVVCMNEINLIKAVRDITGLGRLESTEVVRKLPVVLADEVSWDRAIEIQTIIREAGGMAEVRAY